MADKDLLFSFELCVWSDGRTVTVSANNACYFLLNYAHGLEASKPRLFHEPCYFLLNYAYNVDKPVRVVTDFDRPCYFLLNYARSAEVSPVQIQLDDLLFSFELCP